MGPRPYRPAALRYQVFLGRMAIDEGMLTKRQLRSSAWRRLFRGIYADSRLEITHSVRCSVAAEYLLPSDAVIAGRSAARLYGVDAVPAGDPVEALVPQAAVVIPHIGLVVHRGQLASDDRCEIDGIAVTTTVRTCWDLARWLSPIEAVVVVDQMLSRRFVTPADLEAYRLKRSAEKPTPRGIRRYEYVLALVDGGAESPQESRLRVRLAEAGLPRLETQVVVRTPTGEFVARVDLGWRELRIAIEYDGAWHGATFTQMNRDRDRDFALDGVGWIVVHVTSDELRNDFDGVLARVRAARRRRGLR